MIRIRPNFRIVGTIATGAALLVCSLPGSAALATSHRGFGIGLGAAVWVGSGLMLISGILQLHGRELSGRLEMSRYLLACAGGGLVALAALLGSAMPRPMAGGRFGAGWFLLLGAVAGFVILLNLQEILHRLRRRAEGLTDDEEDP